MRAAVFIGCAAGWAATLAAGAYGQEAEVSVKSLLAAYVEAFNRQDADAIAAQWAEDALWVDAETDERVEGRDALIQDYRTFFMGNPEAQLTCRVNYARAVAPNVASFEGASVLLLPGVDPIEREFSAILVNRDGKWLFHSVTEMARPEGGNAHDRLKPLDVLIGSWVDAGEGPTVRTTVRWGAGGSFLVRSFVVEDEENGDRQGTQVIGWDPLESRIRSWQFESDGSFGDGTWSQDGNDWVGRIRQTLADGSVATATQILRVIDNDQLEVETTGIEVDGQPMPSQPPVRVVRETAPADETATEAAPTTTE